MGVRLSLGAPGSDASGADHVEPRFACRRLLASLAIAAAPLLPLEPAPAQLSGPLRIVAVAGASRIHDRDTSTAAALRLWRLFGPGEAVAAGVGGAAGGSDEGFILVDAGAELRACSRCAVAAFAGAGAGLLSEPEFTGLALRGSAGLEVRLAPAAALRLEGQLGSHDGEAGPHLLVAGIAVRLGRTPLS